MVNGGVILLSQLSEQVQHNSHLVSILWLVGDTEP